MSIGICFEVGKYYKWVGPKKDKLDNSKNKAIIIDGYPRKCIFASFNRWCADFEGIPRCRDGQGFFWRNYIRYFKEVSSSFVIDEIEKELIE